MLLIYISICFFTIELNFVLLSGFVLCLCIVQLRFYDMNFFSQEFLFPCQIEQWQTWFSEIIWTILELMPRSSKKTEYIVLMLLISQLTSAFFNHKLNFVLHNGFMPMYISSTWILWSEVLFYEFSFPLPRKWWTFCILVQCKQSLDHKSLFVILYSARQPFM